MKTDNILTAMSDFSGVSDIPVSLIRHSARRTATPIRVPAHTSAKVIRMPFVQQMAVSA